MTFNKVSLNKNYSVIIVPEKGSKTKTFELSAKTIKVLMAVFFVVVVLSLIFILYFIYLNHSHSELRAKDQYIKKLEQINQTNEKKIKDYSKNRKTIENKLNEIQQLEDQIKQKLKKGVSLKIQRVPNSRQMDVVKYSGNLLNEMENKIVLLNNINKGLDNYLEVDQFIPNRLPCLGSITSNFGYRQNPFNNASGDTHDGIDIGCAYGTKVYAAATGTVEYASYATGYGNEVSIDHLNGIVTIYGHNSKILVHVGQTVNKGDLIALSGSTGSSTGPHLHFEIRKNKKAIDPLMFCKEGEEESGF